MDVFVGSVLLDKDEKILLIKEDDKNKISLDRWNLPGGEPLKNESLIEAVQREVLEETGYNSTPSKVLSIHQARNANSTWIYIVFLSTILNSNYLKNRDNEIIQTNWFSSNELFDIPTDKLVHSDIKLVYQRALRKEGLGLDTLELIEF